MTSGSTETGGAPVQRRRRWPSHFRLMDLVWLALMAAVLMSWHRDHRQMQQKYDKLTSGTRESASWSIDQLLGKPDTPAPGDQSTAWASTAQDMPEWIIVEFPRARNISRVAVYETYNPGAVVRICALSFRNQETEIWKGVDPTPVGAGMGTSIFNIQSGHRSRRLKIYLESDAIPGWNEIDAVRLDGTDGSSQWASAAWASSSYGKNNVAPKWFWP